ncbi:hypothetical protein RND81_08G150200 [Saponaria officinalis]|uniref:Chlorophyllase n=1 Tax=Saponaria officinalis TaxID=3572 RepID=A0AAW1J6R4_SAPOF
MKICMTIIIRLLSILLVIIGVIASTKNLNDMFKKTNEVFEWGKYTPIMVKKSTLHVFNAPKSLVIITPKQIGVYPLLYFVHGFEIPNYEYTQLFNFIASHGIIVVAPMLYENFKFPPSHQAEIDDAANVANWLSSNLNMPKPGNPTFHILPDNVTANFSNFIASGHSRGGKTAFALVLGLTKTTTLDTKISGLISLDPVAGLSIWPFIKLPTEPYILTNVKNSIELMIPTMIIGTGLGGSCAPRGLNHDEFFRESKLGSHFVATDYGHCDMLNDDVFATLGRMLCGSVKRGSYDGMRRTVGGLFVAFLDAYFKGRPESYNIVLSNPSVAPVKLHPVKDKGQPVPYFDTQM